MTVLHLASDLGWPGAEPVALPSKPTNALRIDSLTDVLRRVKAKPPRQYLLRRIWAQAAYGVLSAADKAGKTWADLDLAVSVATGTPWMGCWEVDLPGPVLLFLGEGGEDKAVRRLDAICRSRGIDIDTISDRLHLCFRTPHLSDSEHLAQVTARLVSFQPVLVIIDPFYLAARGSDARDLFAMGAVLEGIQQVCEPRGVALLVTHHWNKGGVGSGHNRATGVGPGAWGRTNISMAVQNAATDETGKTTVSLLLQFQGDETAEPDTTVVREVWADDRDDLNSAMNYKIRPLGAGVAEDQRVQKILQILAEHPDGMGAKALREAVGGNAKDTSALIEAMAGAGQIQRFTQGNRLVHRLAPSEPFPNAGTGGNR